MDGSRFDSWARSRAQKLSRRQAVGVAGATGLAAATARVLPASAQGNGPTCTMTIEALTSAGPSDGQYYTGVLEITLGQEGAIDKGSFTPAGGVAAPVVGESEGRALSLRVTFADGQALVLTGTGENDIASCSGALSGVFGGPQLGDTGSWMIDPSLSQRSGASSSGGQTPPPPPGASPTSVPACPGVQCDAAYVVDPSTCECVCPPPTTACGAICCPAGAICDDESQGYCACPQLTELCGNSCVPSCQMGYFLDYDTCECVEGCDLTCPYGQTVDVNSCLCVDICTGSLPYFCGGACYGDPYYECGGLCYAGSDLNSNADMCGPSCQQCPSGVPCIGGSCQCPATYSYCAGAGCKSLSDDNSNCGACGNVCAGGKTCQGGMCQQ